jgi:hypothetical protein
MGTYARPDRKPINTSGRKLSAGLSRMGDTFIKDKQAEKEKKARDVKEAQQLLDKRSRIADQSFSKGYNSAYDKINQFGKNLSDENQDVFRGEVLGLLEGKRDEISNYIQDNPEASMLEIQEQINGGKDFINNLTTTLTNLEAARLQYEEAKNLKPGEEGALVPGYNPELIKLFEAQAVNHPNMHLTVDDNGGFRFSIVDEEVLGNTLNTMGENDNVEFTSFNATDLLNNAVKGDGFFRTVEPFDYSEMKEMIDAEINNSGGKSPFGKKGKDGEILYNHNAIRDYYTNDKLGQAHLNEFATEGNSEGYWMAYGDEVVGDDGEIAYSNQIDNYSPEALSTSILDGFIGELPKAARPAAVKPKEEVVEEEVVEPAAAKEINKTGHLTYKEINNVSEEMLVPALIQKYGKDFDFEEVMGGMDAIRITSKSNPKKTIIRSLNSQYNRDDGEKIDGVKVYNDITTFIDDNSPNAKSSTKQKPSATTKSSVL